MSKIVDFNARLARLEARRPGAAPELERAAAVRERLVARVDATHDPDEIVAFRAEVEAARRSAKL